MVSYENPCTAGLLGVRQEFSEAPEKIFSILIAFGRLTAISMRSLFLPLDNQNWVFRLPYDLLRHRAK
jgi:hypothetical protein